MIKAIAIDDEPIALRVIEHFCQDIEGIDLEKTFSNAQDGLNYLNSYPTDLIFLDIDMPQINGMDLYKQLKQDSVVVFITAHSDYAVQGFDLNALDYLLKPFTFERFKKATDKAKEYFSQFSLQKTSGHIFVRADYSLQKIIVDDILFIEALDDYLKIHIEGQKTIVARMTMKAILEKLAHSGFMRVHRSYIVPVKKIESLRNKTIIIKEALIPIGNSYEAEISKYFKDKSS